MIESSRVHVQLPVKCQVGRVEIERNFGAVRALAGVDFTVRVENASDSWFIRGRQLALMNVLAGTLVPTRANHRWRCLRPQKGL